MDNTILLTRKEAKKKRYERDGSAKEMGCLRNWQQRWKWSCGDP